MSGIYFTDIDTVLMRAGLTVITEDVNDGWESRARSSGGFASPPLAVFWHHTASQASPYSDLAWMIHNSPDRPIGNLYIDRDGSCWPIAAGASNCAGKGGPAGPFSRGTIGVDSGNSKGWQIEVANSGTGEPWPEAQVDAYFAASNALSAHFGNLPTDVVSHALSDGDGWTDRKIDPAGPVLGLWRPSTVNSSQTWRLADVRAECAARAGVEPPEPEPEPTPIPPDEPEENYDVAFIIENRETGQPALIYGDGKMTGLAGGDLDAYVERFGEPIPTDVVVWADFANKGT
jgi:hypothetical protein